MNCGNIVFFLLLLVLLVQLDFSYGRYLLLNRKLILYYYTNPIGDSADVNGSTLKKLLLEALKTDDCSRRISIQEPIPLRFRRASPKDKFPCVVTVK